MTRFDLWRKDCGKKINSGKTGSIRIPTNDNFGDGDTDRRTVRPKFYNMATHNLGRTSGSADEDGEPSSNWNSGVSLAV